MIPVFALYYSLTDVTRIELAHHLGCSPRALSNYQLQGIPPGKTAILRALGKVVWLQIVLLRLRGDLDTAARLWAAAFEAGAILPAREAPKIMTYNEALLIQANQLDHYCKDLSPEQADQLRREVMQATTPCENLMARLTDTIKVPRGVEIERRYYAIKGLSVEEIRETQNFLSA